MACLFPAALNGVSISIVPIDHPLGCLLSPPQPKPPLQAPGTAVSRGSSTGKCHTLSQAVRHQSEGDTFGSFGSFHHTSSRSPDNEFGEVKQMSPPCGGKLKLLVMAVESVLHSTTTNQPHESTRWNRTSQGLRGSLHRVSDFQNARIPEIGYTAVCE